MDAPKSKPSPSGKRLPQVNYETLKSLVAIHGITDTHRITGVRVGTLKSLVNRHNWPQPHAKRRLAPSVVADAVERSDPRNASAVQLKQCNPTATLSPSEAIASVMAQRKQQTELNITQYNLNTSKDLADITKPKERLKHTRKAKELADVHRTIFPVEQSKSNNILNLAVLVGDKRPIRARVIQSTECQPDEATLGSAADLESTE